MDHQPGVSRLLVVESRRHHIYLDGSGNPPVVFEPAIGDVGLTWALVMPEVAMFTTAFTHDRPGLGDSEPSDRPRTVDVMADELRLLLTAADLRPPYVLVGHSFASLTLLALAYAHPGEVAGIVLVDGAHEDQMERFPAELAPRAMLASFAGQLRELADSGRHGDALPELMPVPEAMGGSLAKAYGQATAPNPTRLETTAAEYEGLEQSQAQIREAREASLVEIPLVALRHGIPQALPGVADEVNRRYETVWQDLQEELAGRSSVGRVIVAEGAGHMIHHDRPDLVVEAIRGLLASAG